MLELAASIREKGVVNPALVRPKPEGGYEMVAGHRENSPVSLPESGHALYRAKSDR